MRSSRVLFFLSLFIIFLLLNGGVSAQPVRFIPLPPTNIHCTAIQDCCYLQWEMPESNPGDPIPVGIKIFKDNELLDSIEPSTTFYYDMTVNCGLYEYWLTTVYLVSPGNFVESDTSNHVIVNIQFSVAPLPHTENWESCNFSYNHWYLSSPSPELLQITTNPGSTNCYCRFGSTISEDAADVTLTNFYMLTFLPMCSELVVSFDLKCRQTTASQDTFRLSVIDRNEVAFFISDIVSSTDTSWKHYTFAYPIIDQICERLRWTSVGAIGHLTAEWQLDNIFYFEHLYPATNLQVYQENNGNRLTWSATEYQSFNSQRKFHIIRYLNGDSITSLYTTDTTLYNSISQPWMYCYTVTTESNAWIYITPSDPTPLICADYTRIINHDRNIFMLSPNPVNNNLCIRYNGHKAELLLCDLTGQLVLKKSIPSSPTGEYRVNLPATLPDGLYLVRLIQPNNDQITRKLIISR
ncbi:MAG TPA: hypothetical protein DCR43_00900 [Bacteroidales bacterium]|nr:hypothetical protein [Bacteroidales bacterium]HBZ67140.1 hypothetical protein [Bacteroidales bacterium]